MAVEVNSLKDVVQSVKDIKDKSGKIAQELKANINEAREALDITQGISDQLRSSVAELRGALGIQTNNPPAEPEKK